MYTMHTDTHAHTLMRKHTHMHTHTHVHNAHTHILANNMQYYCVHGYNIDDH